MIQSHAVIKHKTFAFKLIVRFFFDVIDDATIELIDIVIALFLQFKNAFFTTNSARAEDQHLLFFRNTLGFNILWKVRELFDIWIERALKGADFKLIPVA